MNNNQLQIITSLSPALFEFHKTDNSITVIIDIFRATTSICSAFSNGAKSVITTTELEVAKQYQAKGFLVAAERDAQKCDFADFGNSPFEFKASKVKDQTIVFTTTNGTRAVDVSIDCDEIIIGSFSNIGAVVDFCRNSEKNIILVCAGWNNTVGLEDVAFAGAVIEQFVDNKNYIINSDSSHIALSVWNEAKNNLNEYLKRSEHYRRLVLKNQDESIQFCLTKDTTKVLPRFDKFGKQFVLSKSD